TRRPGSPNTSPTQRTLSGFTAPLYHPSRPGPAASAAPATRACGAGRAPGRRARAGRPASARVLGGAMLPDHRDLDVTRVLHLGLDPLGDVLRELVGVEIRHQVGLRDDAELATRLDRVGGLHALERAGDLLHRLHALDVALQHVPPGAGPGGGDAVGRLDQHGLDRLRLLVVVPGQDGVEDRPRLVVPREDVDGELDVAPLLLVGQGLADVVEEATPLGQLDVGADLGGQHPGQPGHLLGVLEAVLSVGGAVPEAPDQLHELRVEAVDADLEAGALALLLEVLVHLLLDLVDDLLDPGRVD